MHNAVRRLTFVEAIREAIDESMEYDSNVVVIGEGVPDPKGIFGSTKGLANKFGSNRVYDMPLSENGLTGVCIGAAISGLRPILIHQRVDFSLLSMDQIVNNAAKWRHMFNGVANVPIVIRMIVGRGWGQGPQHSQSFHSLFAQIPGLKVVLPACPEDAKGLLISSIFDDDPIVFIEHRWSHNSVGPVPIGLYRTPIGKARLVRTGTSLTIASFSYALTEAIVASDALKKIFNLELEVIDMRSARPLDVDFVRDSVNKTGRLLVLDIGNRLGGIGAELITQIVEGDMEKLKVPPRRLSCPDFPASSSFALTSKYYPGPMEVISTVLDMCNHSLCPEDWQTIEREVESEKKHDVPHPNFEGPF